MQKLTSIGLFVHSHLSLVPQRDQWVNLYRAPRRNPAGQPDAYGDFFSLPVCLVAFMTSRMD